MSEKTTISDIAIQLDAMARDSKSFIEKQRMKVIGECWEYALLNGLTEKEANARVHEKIEPYNKMLGVS